MPSLERQLAATLHPTKNNGLQPTDVSSGSGKKVWWKCSKGHEWEAVILNRSRGTGCPACAGKIVEFGVNDLATSLSNLPN